MPILNSITARDHVDGGDALIVEEWEGHFDKDDDTGHVVSFKTEGTPYLTADELLVFAEQLRDLHDKITRPHRVVPHGAIR